MDRVSPREFLNLGGIPTVDVRSPGEFADGHLPGAINLALFTDEERAEIGLLYKRSGREAAIERGLAIVGPLMQAKAQAAKMAAPGGEMRVYCWRGGMRSEKMAWLFELVGLRCYVLEGGYKAYRRQLMQDLGTPSRLIVLQGATGSGKTDILTELARLGEQVIDLEGLAHHRGSAFGAIGMPPQPTTQQFHNALHATWLKLDTGRRIWVEGESKSIGRVFLPDPFWRRMNGARLVEIEMPRELRVQRLVDDYGSAPPEALADSIRKIERRLGPQHAKSALEKLEAGDVAAVAESVLDYYDKGYAYSREKHKLQAPEYVNVSTPEPAANARTLLERVNAKGW